MSAPIVTVLLPVYNGAGLLRPSLESIFRQRLESLELLVVDDGSTDETPAILRTYRDPRLRVLTNPRNLGLIRALNQGLLEAQGEFVARQDADDVSRRDRLQKQVAYLRARPTVQLLGTSAWRIGPTNRVLGTIDVPCTHEAILWASAVDNPFIHTSVMFRRQRLLDEFNGYDEQFPAAEDYELWTRIGARHPVANLPERLVLYREHLSSVTRTQASAMTSTVQRLIESHCRTLFPRSVLSAEEAALLGQFRLRFPAELLAPLRSLLERLLAEFLLDHPVARNEPDFNATLCRQALRIAYKFLRTEPAVAAAEIARAFRFSPMEWVRQATLTLNSIPTIGKLNRFRLR